MYSARQAEHCRSWEESRYSCQIQWNFPCVWEVTMFPWKRSSVIWTTVVWSISLLNCSWPRPLTMSSWKWFSWRSLYWMEGMLTYKWVFERVGGEGSVGERWRKMGEGWCNVQLVVAMLDGGKWLYNWVISGEGRKKENEGDMGGLTVGRVGGGRWERERIEREEGN